MTTLASSSPSSPSAPSDGSGAADDRRVVAMIAALDSSGNSLVYFRLGNLVAQILYRSERIPQAQQDQGAHKAAQWAHAALVGAS